MNSSPTPAGPHPTPDIPVASSGSGWFANRTLTQKFGALVGVTLLSTGGLLTAVLIGDAKKEAASSELADLSHAQSLVLQIDTRASELKVDGYKALVRPNAADELEELAGDIETPQAMIEELHGIPLTGKPAAAVADLESTFTEYTDAITVFVNDAVADQGGTRVRWEDIQTANDLTDGAVGTAKDALAAETQAAQERLEATISQARLVSIVAGVLGLLLTVMISVFTLRSITGPVRLVNHGRDATARPTG